MFLSIATLSKYGFNKRRLTEQDFYEICLERNIEVQELNVVTSFYISILGREVIVLDKKLSGVAREFAQWHEVSHALLSAKLNGPQALFMGMCDTKEEHEADAFAAMALIPKHLIWDRSFTEHCCCGIASKIYEQRLHIFEKYGV